MSLTGRLTPQILGEFEATAVELARLAGAEITTAFGRTLSVRYKTSSGDVAALTDPVSDADQRVEQLVRDRLAERFPDHDIIGEEQVEGRGAVHDTIWAVDPIDGTTNFVNGFPLFAAAVGVLHLGRPVVGALWCTASHALRAGVYHATLGGPLRFDEEPIRDVRNPQVRRYLVGQPRARAEPADHPWDARTTGSAALECAFVAAGLLRAAIFRAPNVWDVAGGIALVQAAGGEVRVRGADGRWAAFDGFGDAAAARRWRRPLAIGDAEAVERLCAAADF